jgi:hypothetical protein
LHVFSRRRAPRVLWASEYPDRFDWLCDPEELWSGEPRAWTASILSELGRIDDDEERRIIAGQLAAWQPKARDAIAAIRRYRLGRSPAPSRMELTDAILKAINGDRRTHPGTPLGLLLSALEEAGYCCQQDGQDGP